MKLLVILLCLLSERYLVHAVSHLRFNWFSSYCNKINQYLPQNNLFLNPIIFLAIIMLPLIVMVWLIFFIVGHALFGFLAFVLNLLIFY